MKRLAIVVAMSLAVRILIPTPKLVEAAGFQTEMLIDPIFHMKAYDVTIPAGWKFEGVVSPGTACKTDPFPVFRAYAQDGLTEFRRMPRLDWASSNSRVARGAAANCPQLSTDISVIDFLRYVSQTTNATWGGEWPIPAASRSAFQGTIQQANGNYGQSGMRGYSMTGDIGAVRTFIQNGTIQVEQQLSAAMICNHSPLPDGSYVAGCTASVRVLRAPEGKLDALVALIDNHPGSGAAENPEWRSALNQAAVMRNVAIMRQRDVAFRQWSAVMAHNHEQFMQQFNAEGEARTRQFKAHIVAKDTATSDWVDYALDQQTVSGSGGLAKVSSAYTNTWSNGNGQWYQTNDPNANPNGVLSGNWTQQQVVHGNGTAY